MGVPAFFRWLSRKNPSILVHCIEEKVIIIEMQAMLTNEVKKKYAIYHTYILSNYSLYFFKGGL